MAPEVSSSRPSDLQMARYAIWSVSKYLSIDRSNRSPEASRMKYAEKSPNAIEVALDAGVGTFGSRMIGFPNSMSGDEPDRLGRKIGVPCVFASARICCISV